MKHSLRKNPMADGMTDDEWAATRLGVQYGRMSPPICVETASPARHVRNAAGVLGFVIVTAALYWLGLGE